MGFLCFHTIKGAAIFGSSVHIFIGMGLLSQFVTFPMVYSATEKEKDPEVNIIGYLPGILYSAIYLALGIVIFKGIESEATHLIKGPALGFVIIQILFLVLRGTVGMFPPAIMKAELSMSEKPTNWNVYKTLQYFTMTIVGGFGYLFVLFLYLQQLAGPNATIAQVLCNIGPTVDNDGQGCCGNNGGKKRNILTTLAPFTSPPKKTECQHTCSAQQNIQEFPAQQRY